MNSITDDILVKIFDNINDTKTYKSIRLVCKKWNILLPTVKRFYNGLLKHQIFFEKNNTKMFNKRKELIKELYFDNLGNYSYKEYENNAIIKTITYTFPYNINMVHNKGHYITVSDCDIREKKYINKYENSLISCITQ